MEPDWQTKLNTMQERYRHLLQTKSFTDCCFLVGGDVSRQSHIKGHKAMLAVASPVFERMFYGSIPQQPEPICVTDIDPEIFNAMLGYIYMDDFHVKSIDVASDLFHAAQKYMLTHLQQKCLAFIESAIDVKNVCRVYEFAKLFDLLPLQQNCMKLIIQKTLRVLNEPSFLEISMSTFADILDQDLLAINSELDLFKSLLKYASHIGIYNVKDNTTNEQSKDISDKVIKTEAVKEEMDTVTNVEKTDQREQATTSAAAALKAKSKEELFDSNRFIIITKSKETSPSDESTLTADQTSQNCTEQNADEPASRLHEIQDLIKKLRLLTLQPHEFADIAVHDELISSDVALAIFMYISNTNLTKKYAALDAYDCNRKSRRIVNEHCDFPMLEVRALNGHGFAFNASTFQELPTEFNFHNNTVNINPNAFVRSDGPRNKESRKFLQIKRNFDHNGTQ